MTNRVLSRRALLLGSAGAAVGLPWLEAMVGRGARAQAATTPKRYFLAWGGVSVAREEYSLPATSGPGYELKRTLFSLSPVRDEVTLITGLRLPPNGPGSWGGGGRFHNSTNAPILTGVSNPDDGNPTLKAESSDQVVADAIAGDTRFRSLEYRVQLRNYRESARAGTMSARRGADGNLTLNEPQASPQLAYDALFTGFTPSGEAAAVRDPAAQAKLLRDRSVLDRVSRRAQDLLLRLGSDDRQRMERHFEEIRALEMRLATDFQSSSVTCSQPPRPAMDPATTEAYYDDRVVGYSDERARGQLFNQLIHMAFTCDLTRVATNLITYAQCCMNAVPLIGASEVLDLHQLGHNGIAFAEQAADSTGWHVQQLAELVGLLKNTPEGDGSVLDNTALMLVFEGGDGGDAGPHTGDNMWALVAGGAGGLKRGHHVATLNTPHPVNVMITLMQAVGVQTDRLGEVQGHLPELLA